MKHLKIHKFPFKNIIVLAIECKMYLKIRQNTSMPWLHLKTDHAGYVGTIIIPQKNLLKSSYQKKTVAKIFLPKKKLRNLTFQTKKTLRSFLSLEIQSTPAPPPPPNSPCLGTKYAALWYVSQHGNYSFYLKDTSVQQMCSQIHANFK